MLFQMSYCIRHSHFSMEQPFHFESLSNSGVALIAYTMPMMNDLLGRDHHLSFGVRLPVDLYLFKTISIYIYICLGRGRNM